MSEDTLYQIRAHIHVDIMTSNIGMLFVLASGLHVCGCDMTLVMYTIEYYVFCTVECICSPVLSKNNNRNTILLNSRTAVYRGALFI